MQNSEQGRVRKQRIQERLNVLHDTALHRRLKQHLPAAFNDRWTRRHWIHASLFATIGALVATIVPGFSNAIDAPLSTHSTLALPLPPLAPGRAQALPTDSWQTVRIKAGQTLSGVFSELAIPSTVLHQVLEHPGTKDALTRLRPAPRSPSSCPSRANCAACASIATTTTAWSCRSPATRSASG